MGVIISLGTTSSSRRIYKLKMSHWGPFVSAAFAALDSDLTKSVRYFFKYPLHAE